MLRPDRCERRHRTVSGARGSRLPRHRACSTFLRDNLYQDMRPLFAGSDGVTRGPAKDGRVGAVCRDDVADVAAGELDVVTDVLERVAGHPATDFADYLGGHGG